MYQSYSGLTGLLILIAVVIFTFWIIFAAGSFLLGTPIGLAILTLLIARHYWRRHQLQKAMYQAQAQWQQTPGGSGSGFGSFGGFENDGAGNDARPHSEYAEEETHEAGVDRTEYSAAEDVQYKEVE
ncbi:hypothetical protein [Acidaminobacter hydrogenoformans]|uniref:Uncharacterized protein n=1 Tax=Acidaminobacter hydrogenoformans DSM 2784 TaxID=1120920 RepID=A0A1G5RSK9_9FIRM|nr:hypothetical protein [Acidaminobacter hydrogenoformans]SCZ77072.1 hypothetical protein SAMN03080599_00552 [Acidaminobacter hydrogenoformans DSM 2784]